MTLLDVLTAAFNLTLERPDSNKIKWRTWRFPAVVKVPNQRVEDFEAVQRDGLAGVLDRRDTSHGQR